MDLTSRIEAFSKLGKFLSQFSREKIAEKEDIPFNELFYDGFLHQINLAEEHNAWFTKDNILYALEGWSAALTSQKLTNWLEKYDFSSNTELKKVGIVMAGNIPLVGFHDFLSVLICGHSVLVKQSSNDRNLLPFLAKYLEYVAPEFKGRIAFTEDKLEDFDAVIATGSNNTARYFEYYFKDVPSIIRKNRNSVAILTGNETEEDMQALSEDIFRYYGLGCRSVSKVFVPKGYDFDALFKGVYHQSAIIETAKYANNYDYNKAVYIMSQFDILENGFLMIKEDESCSSPIATLFYETYKDTNELKERLKNDEDQIQCIVSKGFTDSEITFGQTQCPELNDYADGEDTIEFLLKRC
ncbi:acyl-CoA reductase [Spongiivirga citrea]|uniref:Acyl-CoA reductase n=1 Tax=Spongiivirga citrea TaxID=1481457 RepID=A0A6M0CFW5_9FLAO|nr:acyl-CoA reductase [Spongiivirga citrea]NER16738.1 acyl-CoA reductase [Spongiivirga citrea]